MARRLVRWIVAVLAVVPLAAACGGEAISGTPVAQTNGLEGKTPAQILRAAVNGVTAANSVHVTGNGIDGEGQPIRVDIRMQGGSTTGSMTIAGVRIEVTLVGGAAYLKTNQAGWEILGAPADVSRQVAGKWVKGPGESFELTITRLADEWAAFEKDLLPGVEQTTLNGIKVVVITKGNGDKLYVANAGRARLLRLTDAEGYVDFSEYGTDFHITAPPNAIDLTAGVTVRV